MYNVKLNLTKLKGVRCFKSKENVRYIAIPIKDNYIFEGSKGCYLNCIAYDLKNKRYNETHFIKIVIPQENFNKMNAEEREAIPIIGSLSEVSFNTPTEQADNFEEITNYTKDFHNINRLDEDDSDSNAF